jgi:L-2-hydroxyglutarate oxidase
MSESIVIVGGGIVGLAAAYRLGQRFPDARITVLEKESTVCAHQSGHNSGVLHAGLYYKPGSAKARLAVRGIRQMVEFCQRHSIPHDVCGKVVVATSEDQVPRLRGLYERGQQNGLSGLRLLTREELHEIEPHAAGIAALRVPEEGIVDYPKVCDALSREIAAQGGAVVTNARVDAIRREGAGWKVISSAGEYACTRIVTCGGLQADRLAALTGRSSSVRIVAFAANITSFGRIVSTWSATSFTRCPIRAFRFWECISHGSSAGASKPVRTRCWRWLAKDIRNSISTRAIFSMR